MAIHSPAPHAIHHYAHVLHHAATSSVSDGVTALLQTFGAFVLFTVATIGLVLLANNMSRASRERKERQALEAHDEMLNGGEVSATTTDVDDHTIFTRCGAVNASDGRFCLLPKGHVGIHQADEPQMDWGPRQPPVPAVYYRYYPWYMGWWGFTPFGFSWSRFLFMLVLTMVVMAFIFSATSSAFHTNCDTRIVTTGSYPDIETHTTLDCH